VALLLLLALASAPPAPAAPQRPPVITPVAPGDGIEVGPDMRPLHMQDAEIVTGFKVDAGVETFVAAKLAERRGKDAVGRLGATAGCAAIFAAARQAYEPERAGYHVFFARTARAVIPEPTLKALRRPFLGPEINALLAYLPKLQVTVNQDGAPILARIVRAAEDRLAANLAAAPEPAAALRAEHLAEYEGLRAAGGCKATR